MGKCKKKLLLLIAAVLSLNLCMAQKSMLGLEAAPLIGWIKADSKNLESKGALPGFSYGLMADLRMAERYYFGTGLLVTYMGGKVNIPVSSMETPIMTTIPVYNT